MFRNPHHQRILKVLQALNGPLLQQAHCFFGGGTAIVMLLGEYRESVDIDFLCASVDGYRMLRDTVFDQGLRGLFCEPIVELREVRLDQYGIRTRLGVAEVPIKFEIVREGRIELAGEDYPQLPLQALGKVDMYAEKLLANTDRFNDEAMASRDIIDLAMMIDTWGAIPKSAWDTVRAAYGESAMKAFHKGIDLVSDPKYLQRCCLKLQFDETRASAILTALNQERETL